MPDVVVEISGTDTTVNVSVVEAAVQVSGVPGPKGQDGAPGGILYIHTQSVAAAEWVVQHDLGAWPIIETFDTAGNRIVGQILNINLNQARAYFNIPVAGSARCL